MQTEYRTDRGIEAAAQHFSMWERFVAMFTKSLIAIIALLLLMFFALV